MTNVTEIKTTAEPIVETTPEATLSNVTDIKSEATEPVADPSIAGDLLPIEIHQIRQLETQAQGLINQIGQLEVKKATLLGRISQVEQQGQQLLGGVAERIGIEKGTPWQVTPEGQARVLSGVPGMTPVPGA